MQKVRKTQSALNLPTLTLEGGLILPDQLEKAALEIEGDVITDARIALGGVAHKPWRMAEAEALLIGKSATKEHYKRVAEALLDGARGYGYNTFKIELAKRAIVRALGQAAKQEPTA